MSEFKHDPRALSKAEILQNLQQHPLWTLSATGNLSRTFRAKNFQSALNFVAAVGAIAIKFDHHPDISIAASKRVEV
jgi:pterin-4a-carbinolamine dehydratase